MRAILAHRSTNNMSDYLELQKQIEAVLFYKGEPMKKNALAKVLAVSEEALTHALEQLRIALGERGITLIEDGDKIALGTSPEVKELIESMRREELEGPLGKAGLETLAIVIYQQPVSRAEIEYVRGVNSSAILRSLCMRGLIEKKTNPHDKRGYLYHTTPELPAALGITSLTAMPGYEAMRAQIARVLETQENPS
jgi:segregation and condensation protein B